MELSQMAKEKQIRWEHKLLDISARSSLLNIPYTETGHKAMLFVCQDANEAFLRAAGGSAFLLRGYPENPAPGKVEFLEQQPGVEERMPETKSGDEETSKQWPEDLPDGALYASRPEADLFHALVGLKRDAAEWIAQTGSRALYLTFGSLKWRDPKSLLSYHSPLLLPFILLPALPDSLFYHTTSVSFPQP